jgi:CRISPR/Cas system CSM-associated protein Csm3 (group 7 of RAMP superfamily)
MALRDEKLYLAHGTLTVAAKGYWTTAGGEKGPLGYYPHLKDESGRPIYPDTQIHGDLLFAAHWLQHLGDPIAPGLVRQVFGAGGETNAALLKIGDLRLTDQNDFDALHVKSRTSIDDQTKTVANHMLVDREYAYFGNVVNAQVPQLSAGIYIGYMEDPDRLQQAKQLLSDAAVMLSGFGGSRSRGYGRGKVTVVWQADEAVPVPEDLPPIQHKQVFNYFLSVLVNVRNRPIATERTQVVATLNHITGEQLRAWFVNTYRKLFQAWPTPAQMAAIRFGDLCPSDKTDNLLGYRPPLSTVVDESGRVEDLWPVRQAADAAIADDPTQFVQSKKKPLPNDCFVSQAGDRVLTPINMLRRMRNRMNDDFTTEEDGLFVQELIESGAVFGGQIRIEAADATFAARADLIFNNVKPTINGAIFSPCRMPSRTMTSPVLPQSRHLVVQPLPLTATWCQSLGEGPEHSLVLSNLRRYNTAHGRPRRNRWVLSPGSVLPRAEGDHTVPWPGFGKKLISAPTAAPGGQTAASGPCAAFADDALLRQISNVRLSRSQAGTLRGLLNPKATPQFIATLFQDRMEKYEKKNDKQQYLYKHLLDILNAQGVENLRAYIDCLWQKLALHRWEEK